MFKHIIVGVDDQQGGRDAIALAKTLAGHTARLTLAYVHAGEEHAWRGSSPPFEAAERERALEILRHARQEAGIDARLRVIGAPSVGRGLHVLAEHAGADLLVVGSTRRGLLGRVLLGDDTRSALNGAPCAVAIAPAGFAEHHVLMREVGVGYNGSPESTNALQVGREIAAEHGATLSAFEVVSLPAYLFIGSAAPADEPIEDAVKDARDQIAALGGVEAHASYGSPAEELALYSASLDLLIVGSRDYGPLGRLVHGSTSHQLAHSARCPLLVLTRTARARVRESELVADQTHPVVGAA